MSNWSKQVGGGVGQTWKKATAATMESLKVRRSAQNA